MIRNAGGRATDDAIRSLVISYKPLGTNGWFVIHHTDCGMQLFDDQVIGGLLEDSLETASIDAQGWHDHGGGPGSQEGRHIQWHSFTDLNASVVADVERIRGHPLVPGESRSTATFTTSAAGDCRTCPARRGLALRPADEMAGLGGRAAYGMVWKTQALCATLRLK